MLGFPALFRQAGILPTLICTIIACICASFCGTMLAEAISMLPGNSDFTQTIDFSSAFRLCVGEDWYVIAETLFLMSCAVQACFGIVEAAQSLDGFMASFLFGKTWGLQFYPSVEFITWSTDHCHLENNVEVESGLADCTPFHNNGPVVLTLGFVLTALMFLPLGRGHLKETIVIQLLSTACLFVLLTQFSTEFFRRGFNFPLPWVGDSLSDLVGVVLFNFAYSITIPSWLAEKQSHVSVNTTIWSCNAMASWIYLSFGLMGAMTFENVGPNLLVLLASRKVHYLTRICAAVFGATIIGCGVPVFCVIIKNALYTNSLCDANWAVFWGAYVPYLLSWLLYQGNTIMTVLSWTGLIINGLVAFILPMVLAYRCYQGRLAKQQQTKDAKQAGGDGLSLSYSHSYDALSSVTHNVNIQDCDSGSALDSSAGKRSSYQQSGGSSSGSSVEMAPLNRHRGLDQHPTTTIINASTNGNGNGNGCSHHDHHHHHHHHYPHGAGAAAEEEGSVLGQEEQQQQQWEGEEQEEEPVINSVQALPPWLEPIRGYLVLSIIWFFTLIISFTIFMDVYTGAAPG